MKKSGRSQAPIAVLLVLLVGLLSAAWVPVGAFAASEEGREASSNYGFSDVFGGEWYATDDILGYAVDNGLLTGYPDGRFGPTDSVVRGQVVTVLWRMAGEPNADSERFDDVDYGQYYGEALLWARDVGVAGGYGGTNNFGPDDPVTREQLAKFVASFAELQGVDISGHEDLSAFADAESVSDWAIAYLGWCNSEGIITGAIQSEGVFANPQANAERAQFAKIAAVLHRDVLSLGFVVGYTDGVVLVLDGEYLPTGDCSAVIDAGAIEDVVPGDVLVFEPSVADSDGMALKVTSVTSGEDGLAVTGVEPELSEVVDELDVSGSTSTASSIVLAPGVEMLDEDIELLATTGSTKLVDKSFKVGNYGTIKLTSTAKYSFDYSWGKINEASVALESKVACDWTASAKSDKTIKLFDADLKTSVPGVSVSVVYYAVFSASGEVHVEASAYAEVGATYKGGKWSSTYDNGLDFAASISGGVSAGVAPTLVVNFLGIGLADAGWEIGGEADGITSLRSSGMVCCDLDIWMYLDLVVGKRDSVLADLGIGKTFNILDRDSGPKWSTHLEDGIRVDECTWGKDEPVVNPDEPGMSDEPGSDYSVFDIISGSEFLAGSGSWVMYITALPGGEFSGEHHDSIEYVLGYESPYFHYNSYNGSFANVSSEEELVISVNNIALTYNPGDIFVDENGYDNMAIEPIFIKEGDEFVVYPAGTKKSDLDPDFIRTTEYIWLFPELFDESEALIRPCLFNRTQGIGFLWRQSV